jgi:hypothetical protein
MSTTTTPARIYAVRHQGKTLRFDSAEAQVAAVDRLRWDGLVHIDMAGRADVAHLKRVSVREAAGRTVYAFSGARRGEVAVCDPFCCTAARWWHAFSYELLDESGKVRTITRGPDVYVLPED